MQSTEDRRIHEILKAARELSTPDAQVAYLVDNCLDSSQGNVPVVALLAACLGNGYFLGQPPIAPEITSEDAIASGLAKDNRVSSQSDSAAATASAGSVLAERYTLEQLIGQGGMGEVWIAHQMSPVQRQVAVKLIKPGMDSQAVLQRFEAERQALALMDHPNIAKVLDGGLTAGCHPFFVMELVSGISLTRYCDEARLTIQERLDLFIPICQAVQHAHHKGIVHRDLKPANILVTLQDGKPMPKIIDFGLAKALVGRLTEEVLITQWGMVIGTLDYMAPEQAHFVAFDIDTRADIYALGVILYELLSGERPLESQRLQPAGFTEILRSIREDEPPPPSARLADAATLPTIADQRGTVPQRLLAHVRGELDWIVMKCLEKSRDRRYGTASDLARDIERYLADEPVEARPPSAAYQLRKFFIRHKKSVTAACLLLLTLVAGIVGTTWGMWREAQRAEGERQAKLEAQDARRAEAMRADSEQKAKELALKRQELLVKATDYFASVFQDFNINKDVKYGERLEVVLGNRLKQAASQLRGEVISDPLVMAKLQCNLGISLLALGHYSDAVVLLEDGRRALEYVLGNSHIFTLRTQHNLAMAYWYAGMHEKSMRLAEQLIELQKRNLGSDHTVTLHTMTGLATFYLDIGQVKKALPLLEHAYQARIKELGAANRTTLNVLNNLAGAYWDDGQHDRALKILQQVIDERARVLGQDHLDTLSSKKNYADFCRQSGNPKLAITQLKDVYTTSVQKLGIDHPYTLATLYNLALAHRDAGQLKVALTQLEQVYTARTQKLGKEHSETLRTLSSIGDTYSLLGQHSKALSLLESTYSIQRQMFGAQNAGTQRTMGSLGNVYRIMKQHAQAISLLEQLRSIQVQHLGTDHPETLATQNNLGMAYRSAGRNSQALQLFQQVHAANLSRFGADHSRTIATLSNLSLSYRNVGQHAKALELDEQVYQWRIRHQGIDHPESITTTARLAGSYRIHGKHDKASALFLQAAEAIERGLFEHVHARPIIQDVAAHYALQQDDERAANWLRKLLASSRANAGTDPLDWAEVKVDLAFLVNKKQKFDEAETLLREAVGDYEKHAPSAWRTFSAKSDLGCSLFRQKKYEVAKSLLLEGYYGIKERASQIPQQMRQSCLRSALQNLVQFYDETGQNEEAAKWRKELEAWKAP